MPVRDDTRMFMTQSHAQKPAQAATNLGVAAAAAATAGTTPTATAAKPEDKAAVATDTASGGDAAKAKREPVNKILVIVGVVHEFETAAKAEKFLNGPDAPTQYSTYRGKRIGKSTKVSLR